jgi:hypothetical protein
MATLAGRPSSTYRLRASAPAAQSHWRSDEQWHERPGVAQFIYLSMLVHAIAILLFGAPTGGSREGRAMWGSLDVQLVAPAAPVVIPAPMGSLAPLPLPKLEREFRPPRTIVTPQVVVPQTMERIAPPKLKLEKMIPVPKMDAAPLPAPKIEVAPLPAPKIEALPLPVPKVEVVPMPAAPPIAIPAPIAPIAPRLPTVERTMSEPPKIEAPLAQPIAPPVKAPVAAPAELPRVETTAVPALPAVPTLPTLERAPEIAPKIVAPAPPVPDVATPPKIDTPPKVETPPKTQAPPDAPMSREELFAPRTPPRPAPPVPAPPEKRDGSYDPTKPSVDLDEMRRRASQIAREGVGQRALLPFPMPAPPPRKTKTEEALEKARKPDCRTAYKDMGLLAAVPLIANEFGEGSCRW